MYLILFRKLMEDKIEAYTKIFKKSDGIQDWFGYEVEVTEKIDGSQFGFGKIKGELVYRSKGQQIFKESVEGMFKTAVDYVEKIADKIPDNHIFYCEYLQTPHHNVLEYDRVPKNNLILFGVLKEGEYVSEYEQLEEYAKLLDIEVVPLLYRGIIRSFEELEDLLDQRSVLGGVKIEGVVAKQYRPFQYRNFIFPIAPLKIVSEKFKEVKEVNYKKNTTKGSWDDFKAKFHTEARWQKAVRHLEDEGKLTNTPQDIGVLMKEVQEDIAQEEGESIKEFLWNKFGKDLLRESTKRLPEWYKDKLSSKE